MRRADRLFRIVELLRSGRVTTARRLAERMEVSQRTIYRDMADLIASGVPVEGEAGTGYVMRPGYDLPPVMFTREEVVAGSSAPGAASSRRRSSVTGPSRPARFAWTAGRSRSARWPRPSARTGSAT